MPPFDLMTWAADRIGLYALVLVRVSTMLFMFPVFSSRALPTRLKAAVSLVAALAIAPAVAPHVPELPEDFLGFASIMLGELILAMILTLAIRMIFAGLQIAGQMVGIQMGLSVANVMDPQTGAQSVIISQFAYTFALLLFLVADGHHALIRVMCESFTLVPVGRLTLAPGIVEVIVSAGHQMFILSVKLMAPVMGILLLSQVALGILAKLVPQINMLIVSLNLNVGLGLFFLGLTMQYFWPVLGRYLHEVIAVMPEMARMLGQPG